MPLNLGGQIINMMAGRSWRNIIPISQRLQQIQIRSYAARKGTREKLKKKKEVNLAKKAGAARRTIQTKKPVQTTTIPRIDDSWKYDPVDNVWTSRFFKWPVYSFEQAINCHRETHHPTTCNMPDALVFANIEFDMKAAKKDKFVEKFTRIAHIDHPFKTESERTVLVFCKDSNLQTEAVQAGAALAGGTELIASIQSGEVALQDFRFILAHPDILPELVTIRGLMKRNFPNQKLGTLGADIKRMVAKFKDGIEYTVQKGSLPEDLGWTFTPIGRLDMEVHQLEANFASLLRDINSVRPKREGPFITKAVLACLPSPERLKVDYKLYIVENAEQKEDESNVEAAVSL